MLVKYTALDAPKGNTIYKTQTVAPNKIKEEKLVVTESTQSAVEVAKVSPRQKARYEKIYGAPITTDLELAKAKEASLKLHAERQAEIAKNEAAADASCASMDAKTETFKSQLQDALNAGEASAAACPDWMSADLSMCCPWFDASGLRDLIDLETYKEKLEMLTSAALASVYGAADAALGWGLKVFGTAIRCGTYLVGRGKKAISNLLQQVGQVNPALTGMLAGAIMTGNYSGLVSDPVGLLKTALGNSTPEQLKLLTSDDIFAVKDGLSTTYGVGSLLKLMQDGGLSGDVSMTGSTYGATGGSGEWSDARLVSQIMGTSSASSWNSTNDVDKYINQQVDQDFKNSYGDYVNSYGKSGSTPLILPSTIFAGTMSNGVYRDPKKLAYSDELRLAISDAMVSSIMSVDPRTGRPLNLVHMVDPAAKSSTVADMAVTIDTNITGLTEEALTIKKEEEANALLRVSAVKTMVDLGDIVPDDERHNGSVVTSYQKITGKRVDEAYQDLSSTRGAAITENQIKVYANQQILKKANMDALGDLDPSVRLSFEQQLIADTPSVGKTNSAKLNRIKESYAIC